MKQNIFIWKLIDYLSWLVNGSLAIIILIIMWFSPIFLSHPKLINTTNSIYYKDNQVLVYFANMHSYEKFSNNVQDFFKIPNIYQKPIDWFFGTIARHNLVNSGEFALQPSQTMLNLIAKIFFNKRYVRKLYIPSGMTNMQLVEILNRAEKMSGGTIQAHNMPPEGMIFADTYHYYHGQNRFKILQMMTKRTENIMNQLWAQHSKKPNFPPYKNALEVLIVASLLEREAKTFTDKQKVCSVILNRLKIGQKLQIDASSQYAKQLIDGKRSVPNLKDLQIPSPFNTYYVKGLPPLPIANPSLDSIKAAFMPIKTNYLYYISLPGKDDLIFTHDYQIHLRNVSILNWQRKQQKKLSIQ